MITDLISSTVNPWLVYIKIGLVVLAVCAVLAGVLYVKKTFSDKERLIAEKAQLEFSLATEKQKVAVAMEQLKIWQETVAKMNAAVKSIKIQSDTYIQGVEDEKKPAFDGRESIPFIVPAVSSVSGVSGFANHSSGRAGSTTQAGGTLPKSRVLSY